MMREILFPMFDQAWRNRLGADVHQPPLVELIHVKLDLAVIQSQKKILCPGNQKPYDRTFLLRYGTKNELRICPFKEYGFAARQEASEPMHLGAGMIKRRNT